MKSKKPKKQTTTDPATITTIKWQNGTESTVKNFIVTANPQPTPNIWYYATYDYSNNPAPTLTTNAPTTVQPPTAAKDPIQADKISTLVIDTWGHGTLEPPIHWNNAPQKGIIRIFFTPAPSTSGPVGQVLEP